jgi:hypothetical protein
MHSPIINDLYKVVTGKPGGRLPLGRSGYRWVVSIARFSVEVRFGCVSQEQV